MRALCKRLLQEIIENLSLRELSPVEMICTKGGESFLKYFNIQGRYKSVCPFCNEPNTYYLLQIPLANAEKALNCLYGRSNVPEDLSDLKRGSLFVAEFINSIKTKPLSDEDSSPSNLYSTPFFYKNIEPYLNPKIKKEKAEADLKFQPCKQTPILKKGFQEFTSSPSYTTVNQQLLSVGERPSFRDPIKKEEYFPMKITVSSIETCTPKRYFLSTPYYNEWHYLDALVRNQLASIISLSNQVASLLEKAQIRTKYLRVQPIVYPELLTTLAPPKNIEKDELLNHLRQLSYKESAFASMQRELWKDSNIKKIDLGNSTQAATFQFCNNFAM